LIAGWQDRGTRGRRERREIYAGVVDLSAYTTVV
jgi:hypothetical protein